MSRRRRQGAPLEDPKSTMVGRATSPAKRSFFFDDTCTCASSNALEVNAPALEQDIRVVPFREAAYDAE